MSVDGRPLAYQELGRAHNVIQREAYTATGASPPPISYHPTLQLRHLISPDPYGQIL